MSNDSIVLLEHESPFSPISQLHYQFYDNPEDIYNRLEKDKIQCMVGRQHLPFGQAQMPALRDFPDGIDTLTFLRNLS